jgi:protein O-GlcNAc transferase
MMPMMSSGEIKLFEKYLSQATNYLEYGSGGSTVLASKFNNIKRIKSIESDSEWASKVELKTRTEMNYINLGKTGGCGTPLENKHLWPTYSQHYSPEFDLVLIDGRFRVACFLDICLKGTSTVLFHDFLNRHQYYGIILQFCQIVESADTLAVLKINDNIDVAKVQEMYKTYSFNSD